MTGWRAFWNRPNRIYVNERHLRVHYRQVADDLIGLAGGGGAVVLDYGCGEALEADRVAASVARLMLYDAADATRARLLARHGGNGRIAVLDEAALAALAPGSIDLIVVNSVAQYLAREEFGELLGNARRWLSDRGRLVLADIVPPDNGMVADVAALLRTAAREGFLAAALTGLAMTAVSDYGRMRRQLRLSTYTEGEVATLAGEAGLAAVREPRNLGFNPRRMTFTLRPAG